MTQSRGSLTLQVSRALAGVLRRLMTSRSVFKSIGRRNLQLSHHPDPPFLFFFKITAEREERIDVKT